MASRATDAVERGVVLIGMPASGKSTVGQLLAARLSLPFVDLDEVIEMAAQSTLAELFVADGEAGFRAREAAALADALGRGPSVLATGGGAPAFGDNLDKMLAARVVVELRADLDTLMERLGDGARRPLLSTLRPPGVSMRDAVEKLLGTRSSAYARAHVHVDAKGPPSHVVAQILETLGAP
jgi:shikimate kinase